MSLPVPGQAPFSPNQVQQIHSMSDVDSSVRAQHHTIGSGPFQAASGQIVQDLQTASSTQASTITALQASQIADEADISTLQSDYTSLLADYNALQSSYNAYIVPEYASANSSSTSIPTDAATVVPLTSINVSSGTWSLSSGGLLVPKAGLYDVMVTIQWPTISSSAYYVTGLSLNGSTSYQAVGSLHTTNTSSWDDTKTFKIVATAGSYLSLVVTQNTGAAVSATATAVASLVK